MTDPILCDECGQPWCAECGTHAADCNCPGPHGAPPDQAEEEDEPAGA